MKKYQNPSVSIDERIEDLLSRMTIEEKILQTDQYYIYDFAEKDEAGNVQSIDYSKLNKLLCGNSVGAMQMRGTTPMQANALQRYAMEETRLGIPFLFCEEALHGIFNEKATCFPQQLGLGATFNPKLGYLMGRSIATEARALGIHETFSPVMDLIRDPRYGRTEEACGEDVYLCSEFARETVLGLQGDSLSSPNAVAAEPKHYVGYGNPLGGLNCAPSTMGRHEIFASCLPVFESAFREAGASNAMCSYNSIDGVPVSMDRELLTDVLREQFGMPGFVRSDLTAIVRLHDSHFVAPTRKTAIKMGMEAGIDVQLYDYPHDEWQNSIRELVESGEMNVKVLDESCRRVLRIKFMLGLFDNPYVDETLAEQVLHCSKHQELALQIAKESICLLKNENDFLPISDKLQRIAVLGPSANTPVLGDYSEMFDPQKAISVLDGIKQSVSAETEVVYEKGCGFLGKSIVPFHRGLLISEDGKAGLTGRYYNGHDFSGEPVLMRVDQRISFNWIYAKPYAELDASAFGVIWSGFVFLPYDLDGCIGFGGQDSVRVYIDGQLLIDRFHPEHKNRQVVPFCFKKNQKYSVRIEWINDARGARVIFGYNEGTEDYTKALEAAKNADCAIVCLGDNVETCGENFDRTDLNLPGNQLDFLKAVYKTGTPVVLVLQTGRPVTAIWEQEHIPAILEAWFPGEKGGIAVAETLFGKNNPSGRLPITFPRSIGQIPCHYSHLPGGELRYVEMDASPLYPFGYGLSYSTFSYSNIFLSQNTIQSGEDITVGVTVTNIGMWDGSETVQLYLNDCISSTVKPVCELASVEKVFLKKGESKRITLTVKSRQMKTLGADYIWRIEPGDFRLWLGTNSENKIWEAYFSVTE